MYLASPEKGKRTYRVEGEYGGTFNNYQEAVKCAKFASTTPEYDFECLVWVVESNLWYDKFVNGKLAIE